MDYGLDTPNAIRPQGSTVNTIGGVYVSAWRERQFSTQLFKKFACWKPTILQLEMTIFKVPKF